MLLKAGQTFSNLLNARMRQLTNSPATASVIHGHVQTLLPDSSLKILKLYVEGFVHASTAIKLGS